VNGERFRWLRMKCSRLFRRRKAEAALDAELQFHFDKLVAQFRDEGLSEAAARRAALREFGAAVAAYREEIRDAWRPPQLADLGRSLRFAVRSLAHSPGFALLAIVTLALGIGANTAMFSVINGFFLRPLPYADSARLDRIYRATAQNPEGNLSPADFRDFQEEEKGYGEVAALFQGQASISEPGTPAEMTWDAHVSSNFFSLLGIRPELGRDFRKGEDIPGRDRVVILNPRAWHIRFGDDPKIIGRMIRIDGEPHEVIGILPWSFNDWRHLGGSDLFRPIALDQETAADRKATFMRVIGRRSSKLSRAEANGFIANFGALQARNFSKANAASSWRTVPLQDTITGGKAARKKFGMLIGLSGFVLLIACSNLANLLLARTIGRRREFAVRAALGASRGQLLGPLIAESLLLSLAGGICAIFVALSATNWFAAQSTGENGEKVVFALDWHVLGWAFAASLLTAVAFGIAPALFALRMKVNDTLRTGGRGTTGGPAHRRFRHLLIVGQFALAMILLAGAGLFIRGLRELNTRPPGWNSDHLVTGTIILPTARYPGAEKITAFTGLALERLAVLPGVASVSISTFPPYYGWLERRKFFVEGANRPEPGREPAAGVNSVSLRYFKTVGTQLIAGRVFDRNDTATSPKVLIISQSTARALFGNQKPIGRRLILQTEDETAAGGEIVGVVVDVESVLPDLPPMAAQIYQPIVQEPRLENEIAIRAAAGVDPASLVASIRTTIATLDPDLPVLYLEAANTTIANSKHEFGVLRDVLTCFAVLGLALASLGVYGVITCTMAQRTNEFAIRFALGAEASDVTRIVLLTGTRLALIGSALGLLGALAVSRFLAADYPGLRIDHLPVLIAVILLLIAVAVVASWLPARRVARINPIEVLRAE
jgi:putative ABC transport system permease protein